MTAFQFLRRLTIHGECNSLIQTIARPGSQRATGQNFCWFETLRKQKAPEQYWPRHCLTQLCHGAGGRPRSRSNPSVVSNCVNIKIVSHYPSIVVSTRLQGLTMFTWGHSHVSAIYQPHNGLLTGYPRVPMVPVFVLCSSGPTDDPSRPPHPSLSLFITPSPLWSDH